MPRTSVVNEVKMNACMTIHSEISLDNGQIERRKPFYKFKSKINLNEYKEHFFVSQKILK